MLKDWLLLCLCPAFTPVQARRLVQGGLNSGSLADRLRVLPADELAQARRQLPALLRWLEGEDCHALPLYAADYPALLATLADPPPILYLQGKPDLLHLPLIAIVGTRKPSAEGRRIAREFAAALVRAGYGIVSGLALGIDAESHAGALGAEGLTLAVLGSGLERLYPKANRGLARQVREQGVLISEFPPWASPRDWHFPLRNRIISGLAHGVLVVEAAQRSGSLITAHLAAAQGREVFAIPGSIRNPQSRGCHALLRNGVKLVENVADILEELPALLAWEQSRLEPPLLLAPQEATVLAALGYGPTSLETLAAETGYPAPTLLGLLAALELQGLAAASPLGWSRVGEVPT
ncbi:MAG TPA: DNA-processing protein DprA [Hyphomicrobiales bacterium]|nr:DNA-processing protein DprA [Hyphomicrobiales bacterium]